MDCGCLAIRVDRRIGEARSWEISSGLDRLMCFVVRGLGERHRPADSRDLSPRNLTILRIIVAAL